MDLRHLTDKTLLADTKFLAGREREITTKILHHLKEIDKRKLYSDLGYSSLFSYCMKELGYSESAASRRIQACRMIQELPQVEAKIEEGILSLSNVSLLNQFFKENDVTTNEEKIKVIEKVENMSSNECKKKLFDIGGKKPPIKKDKKQRVSEDKVRFSITLSDETSELLEKVKGLMNFKPSLDQLIKKIAVIAISQMEKEKFKLNKSKGSHPIAVVNRVIPNSVKREVYKRDKKCTKCGSTHSLQYDHIKPYSMGGKATVENIRLLCFNCNQRARIKAGLQNKKGPHSRAL